MPPKFTTEPLSHAELRMHFRLESEGKNAFTVKDLRASNLEFGDEYLYVLVDRLQQRGWIVSVGNV